jgi:hypothetical protein
MINNINRVHVFLYYQDGYYGVARIPGWAVANHPGQNVYYVCVFNPEIEEFVHQGHSKHLQVRVCIRDTPNIFR